MPYITKADIAAKIPHQHLVEALDDDNDGQVDPGKMDEVLADASDAVDAILGQRFAVPFEKPTKLIIQAAKYFCLETLFERRGYFGENNPFTTRANSLRSKLTKIADGQQPLAPDKNRAKPSVSAITAPSKVHSSRNNLPT